MRRHGAGVDQHVRPRPKRREQRQLALDPDQRRLVRAERMPATGLAVAPHQHGRRRSRDRPAPAPARPPSSTSPSAVEQPVDRKVAIARVDADHHRPLERPPAKSRGRSRSAGCRWPRSRGPPARRSPSTARRPAGPLMITMCCPCSGRPASVTSYPVPNNRPACLSRERRGRSARKQSIPGQDLGDRARKSIRLRLPDTRLSQAVAFVPRASGPGPPPAAATASGTAGSRRSPRPRASISPASRRRRAGDQRLPAPDDTRTRSSATSAAPRADQRQRERPTCRRPRRRESAAPGRRTATAEPCRPSSPSDSPPSRVIRAASSLRRNANAIERRSQQHGDTRPRHFTALDRH